VFNLAVNHTLDVMRLIGFFLKLKLKEMNLMSRKPPGTDGPAASCSLKAPVQKEWVKEAAGGSGGSVPFY